jgi:hypothetical protein
MYIGNIITSSKIEDDNFKVCRKLETIDDSLPTLIVGWEKTKEIYGDKVSILHKKIDDKTQWTFTTKERKVDYDKDIESFMSKCYSNIGKDINYVYIDVMHDTKKKIKKIIKKIYSLKNPKVYNHLNRMIYIYGDNIVFGVDIEILSYIGIDYNKILTKLSRIPNCLFIDEKIFNIYRGMINKINGKVRLIPYIYEIENRNE